MSARDENAILPEHDNYNAKELECATQFYSQEYQKDGVYCNSTWDSISCWPTTSVGSLAIISCPSELRRVKYDTSKNASRFCKSDGTWNNYSDYQACQALTDIIVNPDDIAEATSLIYYTGYTVSLVALAIALWIFLYFKDLRCTRNTFHVNLMITYVLVDLSWIIYASLQDHTSPNNRGTCVAAVFLHYFQGTNFFWMFVEGFYLYMLVVRTFTVDKVKCKVYLFLGWGVPAIVVLVWAIVKGVFSNADGCAWMKHDNYDWIFMGPLLFVLIINLLFLSKIMWVLITKLRATTAESQQYRKAAKALLVLIPLLGVTYILVIVAPNKGLAFVIISYLRAFLLSTQGLTVSILYCFLNGEVKNTLRHHIERWKESHSFGRKTRYSCRFSRDESPRSGTESIRLYSAVQTDCRCEPSPRESCVSCLTTHSFVSNGLSKGANNDSNAKFSEGSSPNPIRETVAQTAPIKCI